MSAQGIDSSDHVVDPLSHLWHTETEARGLQFNPQLGHPIKTCLGTQLTRRVAGCLNSCPFCVPQLNFSQLRQE